MIASVKFENGPLVGHDTVDVGDSRLGSVIDVQGWTYKIVMLSARDNYSYCKSTLDLHHPGQLMPGTIEYEVELAWAPDHAETARAVRERKI